MLRGNFTPDVTPDNDTCLVRHSNKTIITNLYGGIPETLILNVIAWTCFVLLFSVLRQQAWDYGRLALVNSASSGGLKKRWTQLFYAHGTDAESAAASPRNSVEAQPPPSSPSATSTSTVNNSVDGGFFAWIGVTLRLTREQILLHSGPDAVHYLSFQQHLMTVMAIITAISLAVILPVNYSGTLTGDVNSLGHTTISNLSPESPLLWIHVILAIAYVPMVVLIMRRASGRNAFKTASTRTIMVTNISTPDCNKTVIRNYVRELFPDINIEDIQLAYSIGRLTEVVEAYEKTVEARLYCEQHRDPYPVLATPHLCRCASVDGLEFYRQREEQLSGEVARLRAAALNDPLGIAFVTCSTPVEARNVIQHFKPGTYREWHMSFAPAPSDIFWEHLSVSSGHWYVKWTCVNAVLFFFLFFLTTPVYIVNLLGVRITREVQKVTPVVSEFLPTLMMWILAALMPVAVSFSDRWLSHWTRSRQNYSIMTKSFGYLLLMILVLPSLGLTSAQALIEWTIRNNTDSFSFRWQCIFLPDKGAFFVNYVITAAFIGTALELLRFADLIVYIWRLCTARSRAETPHIRKAILVEFPFGIHYAWTIMLFTMSTVYSVICPLIMPFAMVYITLKHFGDRHNLYFAYGPSNMISQGGGKIHSTAVTMTKFAVVMLLLVLAALASVRTANKGVDARAVVLMLAFFGSLIVFVFMSPIKRCTTKRPSLQEPDAASPVYIAKVLLLKRRLPAAEVMAADADAGTNGSAAGQLVAATNAAMAQALAPAMGGGGLAHLDYGTDGAPMVDVLDERRAVAGGGGGGAVGQRQRQRVAADEDDAAPLSKAAQKRYSRL